MHTTYNIPLFRFSANCKQINVSSEMLQLLWDSLPHSEMSEDRDPSLSSLTLTLSPLLLKYLLKHRIQQTGGWLEVDRRLTGGWQEFDKRLNRGWLEVDTTLNSHHAIQLDSILPLFVYVFFSPSVSFSKSRSRCRSPFVNVCFLESSMNSPSG